MCDQYALYAKGFVGSKRISHQLILSAKEVQTVGMNNQWQQSEVHIANKDVIKTFVDLRQFPINATLFEFREAAISTIMRAFGSPCLDSWFACNYLYGRMSESRLQFLEETVHYVTGGVRPFPVEMYLTYIGLAKEHTSSAKSFTPCIGDLLFTTSPEYAISKNNVKVTEFIQTWLGRPGGFKDLVTSAMVLWGDDTVA